MHETCGNWLALTKSARGVWDLDPRTRGCRDLGLGDSGTQKRGNGATRGHKDVGAQGRRDKQITPEFAIYNFWWSRERYCIIEFNKF